MWHKAPPRELAARPLAAALDSAKSQTKPVRASRPDYYPLPGEARPRTLSPSAHIQTTAAAGPETPQVRGQVLGQPLGKRFPPPTRTLAQERAEGGRSHWSDPWELPSHSREGYKVPGQSTEAPPDRISSRCTHPSGSEKRETTDRSPLGSKPHLHSPKPVNTRKKEGGLCGDFPLGPTSQHRHLRQAGPRRA